MIPQHGRESNVDASTSTGDAHYDIAMWDWAGYIDPDFMLSVVTKGQWCSWSDTGWDNAAYDKLYQQQGETVDPEARKQIVYQMQQTVATVRPYLVIDYADLIEEHNKSWAGLPLVGGTSWTELSKIPFESVHRVS